MLTKALTCASCGGRLNENNVCEYCGSRNIVLADTKKTKHFDEDETLDGCYNILVEKTNNKVIISTRNGFEPCSVKLVRIESTNNAIKYLKHNNDIYIIGHYITPMQFQQTMVDLPVRLNVNSLDEFDFKDMKDNSMVSMKLFY